MAKKKVAKKKTDKPKKKAGVKEAPKKGGLPVLQIIGAVVVIALVGVYLFDNWLNDSFEEVDFGVPEVGIDILDAPMFAEIGNKITVTWRVLGTSVDSSELVYSQLPKGAFGNDTDTSILEVDGSGYENMVEGQPTESEFEGETFFATINVEYLPMFMRVHASSGETNYWTDELVLIGGEEE